MSDVANRAQFGARFGARFLSVSVTEIKRALKRAPFDTSDIRLKVVRSYFILQILKVSTQQYFKLNDDLTSIIQLTIVLTFVPTKHKSLNYVSPRSKFNPHLKHTLNYFFLVHTSYTCYFLLEKSAK